MSGTHVEYGWKDAGQKSSHEYLLPALERELVSMSGGRPMRILDLGCGNGYLTAQLAAAGHTVVGADVSRDGIEAAREAYGTSERLRFEVCSVYDDDLREVVGGEVDCVVSLEVVEHLYLPKRLFEQSFAVLRPGGRLVLSTPYHGYLKNLAISVLGGWDHHWGVDWDGGHVKFFSRRTLDR
ncbi:MAG TPA: class I SAM-dependent methyltransferase, partial [Longimicrobiaceae bacterium]